MTIGASLEIARQIDRASTDLNLLEAELRELQRDLKREEKRLKREAEAENK